MTESDSSILVLLQTRMIKCGKVPDKLDKLFTLQNIANLQGVGFTLDFGFKIHRDLTKIGTFSIRVNALHLLKNDETNLVTN